MSKLCYKTSNGEIKKYELKDSVNSSPKLAVRVDNNSTKYLRLKSGTKSGELCLRIGNQNFQVVTWDYTESTNWRGLFPEPFKGMVGPKGDTSVGGCGVWVLVNEDGYPVVAFGRLGADRPDDRFIAYWRPNIAGTDDETKYPGNFTLTIEQLQHPGRLRPNVRMTTVPSNTRSVSEYNSLSVSGQRIVTTKNIGDYDSSKNNIIIADIVASLLNTSNYSGCMWCVNQFASDGGQSGYLRTYVYTYGAQSINKTGIYLQDPTKYPNETSAGGEWFRSIRGIQSDGLAYNGIWATYRPENQGSKWGPGRLSDSRYVYMVESGLTSINSYSIPYIQMYGLSDFGDSSSEDPDWAQRDFYIEFPYAWGEDTNPNDYFTFTPKQVLQALLQLAAAQEIQDFDYGFTRGRNYGEAFNKFTFYSLTPAKGMRGVTGNREHGGAGIWVMVNQIGYPVVIFGRMGADSDNNDLEGYWRPSIAGTEDEEKYPGNFILTTDHLSHLGRLKPNIRLATIVSAASKTKADADSEDLNYVSHGGGNTNARGFEDLHSERNNVIAQDVVNSLLTYAGNYHGFTKSKSTAGSSSYDTYMEHFGYGYNTLNQAGVYYPTGSEEHPVNDGYTDFNYGFSDSYHPTTGVNSEGFKTTAPAVYKTTGPVLHGYLWDADHMALHTGVTSSGIPYIHMDGVRDTQGYSDNLGRWGQRDFYIEFPYAAGENTNPNDYFTFTPKQVLQEFLRQAEAGDVKSYDYGFTRGRNYSGYEQAMIGNSVFEDIAYNQTLNSRGSSTDDDRLLSWVFYSPTTGKILAMIVYGIVEGNGSWVFQDLGTVMDTDMNETSSVTGANFYKAAGYRVGGYYTPSYTRELSANIKIYGCGGDGTFAPTTTFIYNSLLNPNGNNSYLHYYKDDTQSTSRSTMGTWWRPFNFPEIVSGPTSVQYYGFCPGSDINNRVQWSLYTDVTFPTYKTERNGGSASLGAQTACFSVGIGIHGYPVLGVQGQDRVRKHFVAYIEFPHSGYMGIKPSEAITAWYNQVGERTYGLWDSSSDLNYYSNNASIITHANEKADKKMYVYPDIAAESTSQRSLLPARLDNPIAIRDAWNALRSNENAVDSYGIIRCNIGNGSSVPFNTPFISDQVATLQSLNNETTFSLYMESPEGYKKFFLDDTFGHRVTYAGESNTTGQGVIPQPSGEVPVAIFLDEEGYLYVHVIKSSSATSMLLYDKYSWNKSSGFSLKHRILIDRAVADDSQFRRTRLSYQL